jgi:AraC family transcriptional regulator
MKFIQENPGERLDIKTVAEVARLSHFHFHRVFAGYVGETLADYVRKVRMKKAASLLRSNVAIADIAMAAGYLTNSAFSKTFRQTFGTTPSAFKHNTAMDKVPLPAPPTGRMPQHISLYPRIIDEPAHTLFYIPKKVAEEGLLPENIGKAFHDAFNRWYGIIDLFHLWPYIHKRLGVIRGTTSISPEKFDYDAGMVFSRKIDFPGFEEIKCTEIEKGQWAVFLHRGPYNTLWQTWNWIYNYWCCTSGYMTRDVDPYEVYLNYKSHSRPEDLLTEIYIPIP